VISSGRSAPGFWWNLLTSLVFILAGLVLLTRPVLADDVSELSPVDEWGTRFAMAQAGDVDSVDVLADVRPQMDPLVGEVCKYDAATAGFVCEQVGDGAWRMYRGHPVVYRTDVFFNFNIVK